MDLTHSQFPHTLLLSALVLPVMTFPALVLPVMHTFPALVLPVMHTFPALVLPVMHTRATHVPLSLSLHQQKLLMFHSHLVSKSSDSRFATAALHT